MEDTQPEDKKLLSGCPAVEPLQRMKHKAVLPKGSVPFK